MKFSLKLTWTFRNNPKISSSNSAPHHQSLCDVLHLMWPDRYKSAKHMQRSETQRFLHWWWRMTSFITLVLQSVASMEPSLLATLSRLVNPKGKSSCNEAASAFLTASATRWNFSQKHVLSADGAHYNLPPMFNMQPVEISKKYGFPAHPI